MSSEVVKTLVSEDQTLKVEIYRRSDGTFGFEAWKYSDNEFEKCWIPDGRFSHGIFQNEEDAIREARARVTWLGEEKNSL